VRKTRTIPIKGVIVDNDDKWIYDYFGMDATSPVDITKALTEENGQEIEVEINSPGGSVTAGSEIYTALKSYKGNTVGKIVGIAASAASVAAMGVKKLMMSPTAELMIHNVAVDAYGDYREHERAAKVLKDYNSTIANAYMLKSGMDKAQLLKLMNEETYITPEKALEYKLIDEIMFTNGLRLTANIGFNMMIPQDVINKIRNTIKKPQPDNSDEAVFLMERSKAQLNFLKLKGERKYEI
jgi:ATP-dependent Clp endopeptidase proteolytic subunit ClpP